MSRALSGRSVLAFGPALSTLAAVAFPGARLDTVPAAGEDLLAVVHPGHELLLLDADAMAADDARQLVEVLAQRHQQPAVLLVGAHLPANLVRALLKLHRSDVLDAPVAAPDLARAAQAMLAETVTSTPGPQASRCWSVIGAVGGSGATTLSIELAATLARRAAQPGSVALVDLNLADGAASAYLGAAANMNLIEASDAPTASTARWWTRSPCASTSASTCLPARATRKPSRRCRRRRSAGCWRSPARPMRR